MRNREESILQQLLLGTLPASLPTLRLSRRMVGTAEVHGSKVSFGVKGQCDLYGFTRSGRTVEVELKSATGTLSDQQKAWRDSLNGWNVFWFCLTQRAGETHEDTINRWLAELRAGIE